MNNLYIALSVKSFSEILKNKTFPIINLSADLLDGYAPTKGLIFTQDKAYWFSKVSEQEELDNIADYEYSILVEFKVDSAIINSMITNKETGRLSQCIYDYYEQLDKQTDIPLYQDSDENILCVLDTYESSENEDGLSQRWLLKADTLDSAVWKKIMEGIDSVTAIGGIPGAKDLAVEMAG